MDAISQFGIDLMKMFTQFGIDPMKLFIQLLMMFIVFGVAIYATIAVARAYHSSTSVLFWLMLIWFFPIVGPISAILSLRHARAENVR